MNKPDDEDWSPADYGAEVPDQQVVHSSGYFRVVGEICNVNDCQQPFCKRWRACRTATFMSFAEQVDETGAKRHQEEWYMKFGELAMAWCERYGGHF